MVYIKKFVININGIYIPSHDLDLAVGIFDGTEYVFSVRRSHNRANAHMHKSLQ